MDANTVLYSSEASFSYFIIFNKNNIKTNQPLLLISLTFSIVFLVLSQKSDLLLLSHQ